MITDKQMVRLGFNKSKVFNYKKTNGVSSFCWVMDNGFKMSIEKDLGSDEDESFMPTLRVQSFTYYFTDINVLENFLKVLLITNK